MPTTARGLGGVDAALAVRPGGEHRPEGAAEHAEREAARADQHLVAAA